MTTSTSATGEPAAPARRRRHWVRRILVSLGVVIVLLVAAVVLYVKFAPVPAPLGLPSTPAAAPAGPLEGTWQVAGGSTAGYRIQQTVLFASNDVVQRTGHVTGELTVAGERVTAASVRIDLTTIASDNGTKTPQLAIGLDTAHHPEATVALTGPVALDPAVASGGTVTTTAAGELTLRGETHPVTITLTARRDGDRLQAAGSMPVAFADWHVPEPTGYGPFGSLANHGTAEFLLILERGR